ncbi:uncharacterized protein LOC134183162 isoform X2 [Corticium candelabrum]|uniref:uncharacterized protein LOC134183162 isoform X2 n=1 Tax=Corticium candelabrum TaxID=121492 RepID=UPI002E26B83E|nr:uncharacterized protein LOC134183162 isoform X2 [Corticium candelabrum]
MELPTRLAWDRASYKKAVTKGVGFRNSQQSSHDVTESRGFERMSKSTDSSSTSDGFSQCNSNHVQITSDVLTAGSCGDNQLKRVGSVEISTCTRRQFDRRSLLLGGRMYLLFHIIPVVSASVLFWIELDIPPSQYRNGTNASSKNYEYTIDDNLINSSKASRFCHPELVMDRKGKCILPCNNFSWLPSLERQFNLRFIYFASVTFLVFAIAATIVWIKLRRALWTFPHIMPLYIVLTGSLLSIFAICFLAVDLESSYCNEMDLLLFVDNPSLLCIFAGAVTTYLHLAAFFWWTCFIFNICWVISNPLRAQNFFLSAGKIHAIQLLICWVVPACLVVLPLALYRNYSAVDYGFGTILCGTSSKWVAYVTTVIPIQISTLIIIVVMMKAGNYLYKAQTFREEMVCNYRSSFRDTHAGSSAVALDRRVQEIQQLRIKFSFVAHIYPLSVSAVLVNIGLKSMYANTILYYVEEYYTCLVSSSFHAEQCSKQYLDYQYPAFSIIALLLGKAVIILIMIFLFSQRVPRTGLWDITIGLIKRVCCKGTS